jgi:hypothetical protein
MGTGFMAAMGTGVWLQWVLVYGCNGYCFMAAMGTGVWLQWVLLYGCNGYWCMAAMGTGVWLQWVLVYGCNGYWFMAVMGTLVTFLFYSAVVFYVVIIAGGLHWIIVTAHRYTLDSGYYPVYVRNNEVLSSRQSNCMF